MQITLFSIDYFSNMIKPVRSEDPITIMLGNDNPIKVEFNITQITKDLIY